MCIIIYKDRGVALPTQDIIEACFYNNPHGAGLALWGENKKEIDINKGFMSLNEYLKFIDSQKIKKSDLAVFHFRITTSGGTCQENCHPFPISDDIKKLKALSIKTKQAFIHNGILGQGTKDLSDTQLFVKEQLYSLRQKLTNKDAQETIKKATAGSRTVTLDAAHNLAFLTGEWITDKETGLLFSNSSYQYSYFNKWISQDYADLCPYCYENLDILGGYWGLAECPNCKTVLDVDRNVVIEGLYSEYLVTV